MAATTETTAGSPPATNPVERLRDAFNRLSSQQKIIFMVAIAAIIAGIRTSISMMTEGIIAKTLLNA